MSRWLSTAIAVFALYGCMASAAYAQYSHLRDNIELNLFGGGSWYTHNDFEVSFPQSVTPIEDRLNFDRAVRGGVRLGVYTHGHWSEELFYSYEPNTTHLVRFTPTATSVSLPTRVQNYGVTALYYFHDDETHHVRPFLSIGVGGTLYMLTAEAQAIARDPQRGNLPPIRNSNELSMNYGIGVKTRVNRWLGFRADARGFVSATPSFGLPHSSSDPAQPVLPVSGATNNGEASAGLVFYFFERR